MSGSYGVVREHDLGATCLREALRGRQGTPLAAFFNTPFFSEACLTGQVLGLKAATAMGVAKFVRISKVVMIKMLHDEPGFSELFLAHLLARNIRTQ